MKKLLTILMINEADQALRARYGIADRWVRFLAPCDDSVLPVRLVRKEISGGDNANRF
ncbi:MAG: hypothetical protein KDI36_04210 [Pseudomonadales bacterium]|nr:hypothetical protein [Pseudomonadales bacterium]